MSVSIVSINIGKPKDVPYQRKEIYTAIFKHAVEDPVFLSTVNFAGDGQGDLINHGGIDKAVCVYPYEHYPYWEKQLDRKLTYGAFGENITTLGMTEEQVCIGDIFQLGQAVVQISQPREPCFKLSLKYGVTELPLWVQQTGFSGYYFRVLQEGMVSKADAITRIQRHPLGITVSFANQVFYQETFDEEAIQRVMDVKELSNSWRENLRKKIH